MGPSQSWDASRAGRSCSRISASLCRLLAASAAMSTYSAVLLTTQPAAGEPMARKRLALTLCAWQLPASTAQQITWVFPT